MPTSCEASVRDATALALYCALIFWLSSRSSLPMPPPVIPFTDKWIHAAAYAVMGWLAVRTWRHHFAPRTALTMAALFCSLYGISDEWHQSFVPGRDADPLDWLADTIGGTIGSVIGTRSLRRRESNTPTGDGAVRRRPR